MKKEDNKVSFDTRTFSLPRNQEIATPHRQAPPKKRVTFASDTSISISSNRNLSKNEKGRIWYNVQDLQSIRAKARALALRIHSDRDKNDFEYSYACTMEAAFKQAQKLSEDEELKLWAWFSKAHARRGLERLSASQAGRNRQAKAAIRKVLQAQKELIKLDTDRHTRAKMLAAVSETETKQARALAKVFGKADMVAATMGQLNGES